MIVTIGGRQREIRDLKVMSHANEEEYAEYTVVGTNSEWIDWTPLDEFRAANPGVI